MSRSVAALPIIGLTVALGAGSLRAQDWKDHLDSAIRATITLTKMSFDARRISEYGTPLIVQKEGISAGPARDVTMLMNYVRDGAVRQAGGFAASMTNKKNNRDFTVGERVYMTKLDVNNNDIVMFLLSSETSPVTIRGSTEQTRYRGALKFEFPDGYLATADRAQVLGAITAILKVERTASSEPATIRIGQTTTEVESALGKPDRIIDLGGRIIWVYKDLKVTFTDGKVSDVQ